MRLLFLGCFVLFSSSVLADSKVYRWKDEQGNWVFSDVPRQGAQEIQLNKSMTMPAVDTSILNTQASQKAIEYTASITSPNHEQTLRENTGTIYVTGQIQPSFSNGLKVQLTLDGKATGPMQTSTTFVLHNVPRGEHSLLLRLYNEQGKVLAQSDPTTFYLHRKSIK
ncbi:DUF4124 domain-containing protein [Pseudoalteromonas aurantia]|uniref:DUF4124 domain-containing protein n=1 Tax=Pseudoalteromonas aurantia 208 TaxID=1314867 RepID=A0ABR9EFK9_9GAMM|nr:DUF4124 domain-containing protein [Pseudoalteromonas aurantia]MBE0369773.1 hypothetical protein [Pseudoalteromonas aurantia 208]